MGELRGSFTSASMMCIPSALGSDYYGMPLDNWVQGELRLGLISMTGARRLQIGHI